MGINKEKKYFGTDGIRGRVGEHPISPDFILKLGFSAGKVLAKENRNLIIIGKDTRLSGYMFESALEAGLSAAGVDISLVGPMPTPAIAYLTKTLRASAGIVISASHNPYYDNGIKFFNSEGKKLSLEQELEIESYIDKGINMLDATKLGKASRIDDAPGRYIEFCKSSLPFNSNLNKFKIVLDCANGATYHIAPKVFKELGASVINIANNPDGVNINKECGSTNPSVISKKVIEEKADLGIALDGDGDRVIMVDHNGSEIDGDTILYIIVKLYKALGSLGSTGVVGTIMSNLGLQESLSEIGVPFVRTKVGDKFISQELDKQNWSLGGEPSGHIICKDKVSSGDGIIAAIKVLHAMLYFDKDLSSLAKELKKFEQVLLNIPVIKDSSVVESEKVKQALSKSEDALSNNGRIVLRASGTEPVLRLMVEGRDKKLINAVANNIKDVVTHNA